MKFVLRFVLSALVLSMPSAFAEPVDSIMLFHLSFEDFGFMDEDAIKPSELKTIEDRGITLVSGRFGNGLQMTLTPHWDELFNNSGVDLDMFTSVQFNTRKGRTRNVRNNEPILFGAGKIIPRAGAVAFWVKGPVSEGMLFNQSAMAWGRSEKHLFAVTVEKNQQLGAYIADCQYIHHVIKSTKKWNESIWNHVVLNWDNAYGLELFVNVESVASSWGKDAWWETPLSGLFHFPMPHVVYDEFYSFSRPLTPEEISSLMKENRVTFSSPAVINSRDARDRLALVLGLSSTVNVPVLKPMDGPRVLTFKEIVPTFMGDGKIPAPLCQDGRYELAWPLPIGTFTIISGDGVFPAEKLEIVTPQGVPYNYITLEGNLRDLPKALTNCRKDGDQYTGTTYFTIPQDGRFFYGTVLERKPHPSITLPFLHGYGETEDYRGNIKLPKLGVTRVHEVNFFDVTEEEDIPTSGETVYYLRSGNKKLEDRYEFARKTLLPLKEQTVLWGYQTVPAEDAEWFDTGYFQRLNLITTPVTSEKCIGSIVLDFKVKTQTSDDVLLVRLRDPMLPNRIWTHAEVKLAGFDRDGGRLRLKLNPSPLILKEGDSIWLDIATYNNAQISINRSEGSCIILKTLSYFDGVNAYEMKAMMPAIAEKDLCHYQPWIFVKQRPDIMNPYTLGGQYDIPFAALATKRAMPQSRLADYYLSVSGIEEQYWKTSQTVSGKNPEDIKIPEVVPRWAYMQHIIQNFRYRVVDWMIEHQNDDGQLGEGWNDDMDFIDGKADMPLDGDNGVRNMYLKIFQGIDDIHMLWDGFCQISPMDTLHVGDMYMVRWLSVPYMLGDPHIFRRSLETAWHVGKPGQTPVNYVGGGPYTFDKNILSWYWNQNYPAKVYKSSDEQSLNATLARTASLSDDLHFYQYTEMRASSHDLPGENALVPMIIGGWERNVGSPKESRAVSIAWPAGGGEDLARWVTYGDSKKIECRIFSFDPLPRQVTAQPYMIEAGTYEITLAEDNNGNPGPVLFSMQQKMKRFDTFTLEIPSGKPVLLKVQQIKSDRNQGPFPDLAIADYDCERSGSVLKVRVSNVGAAESKKTALTIYDSQGKKIAEKTVKAINAPLDYVEKSIWVEFSGVPSSGKLRIIVDEQHSLEEIYKGNNTAVIQ